MALDTALSLIYQYVQDDVNRPDMRARILRRIQRAILRYHRIDFWKQDTREQIYQFTDTPNTAAALIPRPTGANSLFMTQFGQVTNTQFIQSLDINKLETFRHVWYLRKYMLTDAWGAYIYDPSTGLPGTVQGGDLSERAADTMFDGYGYNTLNTFYRSANEIRISADTPLSMVYIGYYRDPRFTTDIDETTGTVVPASTDSWIAQRYPDLITADVKAKVFSDIGKTDEMRGAQLQVAQELALLQINNVRLGMR